MLPITQFPRRFATAHKRMLLASAQVAVSSSSSSAALHGGQPTIRLVAPLSTRAASNPSSSSSSSAQIRQVQTKATSMPSPPLSPGAPRGSGFATAASAIDDDDDDDDHDDDSHLFGERDDQWFTTDRNPRHDPTFPGKDPATGRLHSVAMPNLNTCSRTEMLDYLDNTWALMDALFATLQGHHAFVTPPPHHLRHPLIFYYGHPTCFYVNKLVVAGLLPESVNPYFEQVFEVGVDEMRWDDMSKNEMTWPSVAQVTEYRRTVYQLVRDLILTHPGLEPNHVPIDETNQLWALTMALEHDRIHLETSSMLMLEHPVEFFAKSNLLADYHESAYRAMAPASKRPIAGEDYPVNDFLPVPETSNVTIGKPREFPTFGWDNEYGSKQVDVPSCEASKFMVSNGEYFEFVSSGGYLEPSFWSPMGWEWRCFRNTKWPQFWTPCGPSGSHQYKLRALFDVLPMQWDWPAQVNLHEAQAFCKWKNARDGNKDSVVYHLTTEPIHQLLRNVKDRACDTTSDDVLLTTTSDDGLTTTKSKKMADAYGKNLNLSYASFSPVHAMAPSTGGFHDVFGNAWEWCEDLFSALPGFSLHKYYDDFSAPCFDGEHHVIMGGSFISTGDNGASKYARFHFRPHFFQHAGFRVVKQFVDQETKSYPLVTTCVNAPGPYVKKTNPFRSSAVVALGGEGGALGGAGGQGTGGAHCYEALLDEIYSKSESALERFMHSLGDSSKTLLVRNGSQGARKLKDQLTRGDVMVVVTTAVEEEQEEQEKEQLHAALRGEFALVQSGFVPVFTKHSDKEARVSIRSATAWRKQ